MRILVTLFFLAMLASNSGAAVPWLSIASGQTSNGLGPVTDGSHEFSMFGDTLILNKIEGGSLFGLSFGVDVDRHWTFGLAYQRLSASSSGEGEAVTAESDLPVHIFKLLSSWHPVRSERFKAGVGIGVGVGYLSGVVATKSGFPNPFHGDTSESSTMFDGQIEIEYAPVSTLWIVASAGIRKIIFDEVTVGIVPMIDETTGNWVPFDYSGSFVQLGLKWELPGGSENN